MFYLIKYCICDIIFVSAGREMQLGLPALVLYQPLHWVEQMQKTTDTAKIRLTFTLER